MQNHRRLDADALTIQVHSTLNLREPPGVSFHQVLHPATLRVEDACWRAFGTRLLSIRA